MLYRLDALLLRMRLAGTRLIRDAKHLKRDERGLSGAVVAILLILIAVLVVVAMWNSLKPWLEDMWGKVTSSTIEGPDFGDG